MEREKRTNEDEALVFAGKIMNDIYSLSLIKNIDIDIIQEGLLKKVMDEEDSNDIQFVEESNQSKNELTILNAHLRVDEKNYTSNKHELRYADINISIDFKKELFTYSIDNTKIHKCYHYKITVLLDYITEEGLNFKESVLHLYNSINDCKSMQCTCWGEEKKDELLEEDKKVDISIVESCEKREEVDNTDDAHDVERPSSDRDIFKDHMMNWYGQKDFMLLSRKCEIDELKRSITRSYSEENIIFASNGNGDDDSEEEKKSYKSLHSPVRKKVTGRRGDIDVQFLKGKKKERGKEKKRVLEEKGESSHKHGEELARNRGEGITVYAASGEENKQAGEDGGDDKKDEVAFSMKDAEEISNFLKNDFLYKMCKVSSGEIIGKGAIYAKEEEKKKKKFMKIMNENTPMAVILSNKGNEICKELINKYSRYYREFEEEKILGCGGFGYVMKVKTRRFNNTYALKKITLSNCGKGSTLLGTNNDIMNENNSYIMEEAIMIAKLQHENIVRYYDAWVENNIDYYLYSEMENNYEHVRQKKIKKYMLFMEEIKNMCNYYKKKGKNDINMNEKYLYILMEYCPGKTLREAIDCGFIYKNEKLIWELIKQILKGLYYIHDMRIIHRDIKPSNIFLQVSDNILTAKIGDFGLTTKIENNKINPSAGTVNYMSPEQINGEYFDQKADIFSLGVVFFEMFHEPFCTLMERSVVLSNLVKGIYPEYMKLDTKRFQFLSKLLAINPQERSCAYSLLHDNFLFSFEKNFNEIYNLVKNKTNCEEVHKIISTLFDKFDNTTEEQKTIKKEDIIPFQCAKLFTDESVRKNIKKKIISSLQRRGAIFLITPIILRHKYYINLDNITIEDNNYSQSASRRKENKTTNIFMNTSRSNNVDNMVYLLDIYGNTITLRSSFFLSFSEYIYENLDGYNRYNEANFFQKFYTKGYTYKYPTVRGKQSKKEVTMAIYPEEIEKIFYCIVVNTKNVYGQEELNYLSIFSNADILVSVYTLYNHISYFNKLLFVWSYIDLLPLILNECLDISEDVCNELSIHLKKNIFQSANKSSIKSLVQKFKIDHNNVAKTCDFIFNLLQIKCENRKVDEYLSSLTKFVSDTLGKKVDFLKSDTVIGSAFGGSTFPGGNTNTSSAVNVISSSVRRSSYGKSVPLSQTDKVIGTYSDECGNNSTSHKKIRESSLKNVNNSGKEANKMNVLSLLDKVKKINNFIVTNTIIENTCFDLFLNYEENVFSNEIVFYVISESKNKDIIAYGGKFDNIIQRMSSPVGSHGTSGSSGSGSGSGTGGSGRSSGSGSGSSGGMHNANLLSIKAYGVEIYVEKIFLKVTESNEKMSFNVQSMGTLDKPQIFKNFLLSANYENNFACTNNLIPSSFSNGPLNYSSPKVLIQAYEMEHLLVAYDLSKKLLSKNISSYTYFSMNNANIKKKVKNFKPQKIQFIISIKSASNDTTSFDVHNPIKLNEVIYKIFNSSNQDYNFTNQEELINYLIKNT
ncbi:eukaryotic initiation factor 2alpha kinase 1, putative [Plasmodium ovale]|uniref:Eukaryotic initiation factor 2alpha kinase 1, putative n=1 Tax=Plasmodium ovale TaxID=36330 RepID=A0A1D3TLJ5_PLAOA|nr:eukaryotic initiation factor 2alpha kinase 1, putative [Plasmodium ovale]